MKTLSYLIFTILCLASFMPAVISSSSSELFIHVEGNPVENFFTGIIKITYQDTLNDYTEVTITLPFEGNYNILNITSSDGILISDYQLINNTLTFLLYNTSGVAIFFTVENVFEEAGVGSYTTFVDLTRYSSSSINMSITLVGTYYVEGPFGVKYLNGNTVITATQPGLYPISISIMPETTTPPSGENQGRLLLLASILIAIVILLALIFLFRKRK